MVPKNRRRSLNAAPIREDGSYVIYWMTAYRRCAWNFSLDHALRYAEDLKKPLVILEALRFDYPWACERFHSFVIQGMRDNLAATTKIPGLFYWPYLEDKPGAGRGLVEELAKKACLVVGDDFPCFFLPKMQQSLAQRINIAFELVDGNGLWPMAATEQIFTVAHSFRRHLQKQLLPHLKDFPLAEPFANRKLPAVWQPPKALTARWRVLSAEDLSTPLQKLCPGIPAEPGPVDAIPGGRRAALAQLQTFFDKRFARYAEHRNDAETEAASGLSPYLHFGHLSSHEVFSNIVAREHWTPSRCAPKAHGKREGWWGMSANAEAFLDEFVTWREIGFNQCSKNPDYDQFESLPGFAQTTLREHEGDPRPYLYSLDELDQSLTHDELWNAAQRQLRREGRIHNYLRMLWGKKILEWSPSPREALKRLIELNNRYALDGRNPNSYSGIFWVLGRYDRAWGPERPIYGKIRYMASENTRKKLDLKKYLIRYGR